MNSVMMESVGGCQWWSMEGRDYTRHRLSSSLVVRSRNVPRKNKYNNNCFRVTRKLKRKKNNSQEYGEKKERKRTDIITVFKFLRSI